MRQPAPILLAHAALAVLLAAAGSAQAQGRPATVVEAVGDAVIFRGRIDARSAAQFMGLLRDPKITRLVISSGGGNVAAALDMALAIHARQLDVDVDVPTVCHSSCANYVFPAGRRKTVGRARAVAWHGNMTHVLHLHQTGKEPLERQPLQSARELALREAQFFRQIGVDGFVAWFAKIGPYNVEDFYALSAPDMERFGIRNVTVPAASDGEPDPVGVRMVRVDWSRLEADRPVVRLEP